MIETERKGGVLIVRLARPKARNALTPEMLADLAAAFAEPADAYFLEGAGKVFCAGFDLKLCAADPSGETMKRLLIGLDKAIRAMRAAEAPVVAYIHGAALAGGCALLGGADIVLSPAKGKIGYPVVRIGVSPAVSAPFLMAQTNAGFTRLALLDPGYFFPVDAWVNGLLSPLPLTDRKHALELASDLAAKPREGLLATKAWLNELTETSVDGLAVSLSLAGGDEERRMLADALGGTK